MSAGFTDSNCFSGGFSLICAGYDYHADGTWVAQLGAHYKEGGNEASATMVPLTDRVLDSVLAGSCESSIRSQ